MDDKTDTSVRSEGAELYVQAYLMLELGIPTTLASRNMPGYDLIAHNIDTGINCRLQVKHRKAINSDGAKVKNFDFDFMVYVAGNIGTIGDKRPLEQQERRPRDLRYSYSVSSRANQQLWSLQKSDSRRTRTL